MSSTNRGKTQRVPNDFYATPDWLTEAIVPELKERLQYAASAGDRRLRVLEPAAGDRRMVKVLERELGTKFTVEMTSHDLADDPPVDFLKTEPKPIYDLIITNPPFIHAQEFVQHALRYRRNAKSVVAMILRVNFLGSKKRAAWLREHRPALYVTPRRPSFSANHKTDSIEYAWFLWQEPYEHNCIIDILPTEGTAEPKITRKQLVQAVQGLKKKARATAKKLNVR